MSYETSLPRKSQKSRKASPADMDASGIEHAEVLAYLREHPDFFTKRDKETRALLNSVKLPLDDGDKTLSLAGYQSRMLREEKEKIIEGRRRDQVISSFNHELMLNLHKGCLALLRARDLSDLCKKLKNFLKQDIKVAHFALLLTGAVPESSEYRVLKPINTPRELLDMLNKKSLTAKRKMPVALKEAMVGEEEDIPRASYLFLPLRGPKAAAGGLCLFSEDANRFDENLDTHMMDFFKEILAIALMRCKQRKNANKKT